MTSSSSATLRDRLRIRYDPHAVSRMATLNISEAEVLQTINHPVTIAPGSNYQHPDRLVYGNGEIEVVISSRRRYIVTVRLARPYIHGCDRRAPHAFPPTLTGSSRAVAA